MACYCVDTVCGNANSKVVQGKQGSKNAKGTTSNDLSDRINPHEGMVTVQLWKKENENLGLRVSGGADRGEMPVIASIQTGSVAELNDCLLVGDQIFAINGMETLNCKHQEIVNLVKNSSSQLTLEIVYKLPPKERCGMSQKSYQLKRCRITLEKGREDQFGFTIRGGYSTQEDKCRPMTLMNVRKGSVAQRNGQLKPGDHLMAINGLTTEKMTCTEAMQIIRSVDYELHLEIEYCVANQDPAIICNGQFAVEIQKASGERLGISLSVPEPEYECSYFVIDRVLDGSIADRCGALHVGDKVVSVNHRPVEAITLSEAVRSLYESPSDTVHLEICPAKLRFVNKLQSSLPRAKSMPTGVSMLDCIPENLQEDILYCRSPLPITPMDMAFYGPRGPLHTQNSIPSSVTLQNNQCHATSCRHCLAAANGIGMTTSLYMKCGKPNLARSTASIVNPSLKRVEECTVRLICEEGQDYGLTLACDADDAPAMRNWPIVAFVQPGGAAYRSGCIQVGDRLMYINGRSTLGCSFSVCTNLLQSQAKSGLAIILSLQFDVGDAVIPTEGEFQVRLRKVSGSLGINLQALHTRQPGDPLIISKVIPGGVAHRSGTLSPGDLLLSIDGCSITHCSLDETVQLLQRSPEIVTLTVRKIPSISSNEKCLAGENSQTDRGNSQQVIRVQLFRNQPDQDWGLVLAGRSPSQNGNEQTLTTAFGQDTITDQRPLIHIESIATGGLAARCGLLCPGDILLAINEQRILGHNVAQANEMLQQFPDRVSLKVKRRESEISGIATKPATSGPSSLLLRNSLPVNVQLDDKNPSRDSAVDLPDSNVNTDSDSTESHYLRQTSQLLPASHHSNIYHLGNRCDTHTSIATYMEKESDSYSSKTLVPSSQEQICLRNRRHLINSGNVRPKSLVAFIEPSNSSPQSTRGQLLASVRIIKGPNATSFGLALSQRENSTTSDGNVVQGTVYVCQVVRGSAADACKHVQPNDEILKVNHRSVEGMSVTEVVQFISHSGNVVDLVLRKNSNQLLDRITYNALNSNESSHVQDSSAAPGTNEVPNSSHFHC